MQNLRKSKQERIMKRGKEKKKEEIGKQCSRDRAFYYCEHCGLLQLVELGCKSFALLMPLSFCSLDKEKEAVRF